MNTDDAEIEMSKTSQDAAARVSAEYSFAAEYR
jgi:hypothetical protein